MGLLLPFFHKFCKPQLVSHAFTAYPTHSLRPSFTVRSSSQVSVSMSTHHHQQQQKQLHHHHQGHPFVPEVLFGFIPLSFQ